MDLKQIVKEVFNKTYRKNYKLIHLGTQEGTGFMTFIITKDSHNVLCTFEVSPNTGVFHAESTDNLLSSPYEVEDWLKFITAIRTATRGQ